MARASSAALVASALVVFLPAAHAGAGQPVLGKWKLTGRYGVGWGTAHPATIFNGGDPSGRAWRLRWVDWGAPSTTASGLTWLAHPRGGYFAKPGAIELRAYRLGRCIAGGPPAYTRLVARVATRPGGPMGKWFAWGGWRSVCRFP